MEGGHNVPTLPPRWRLAKTLNGTLNAAIDEGDSRITLKFPRDLGHSSVMP
jgi:hypothetical protein